MGIQSFKTPGDLINDNAGYQDYNNTWSAHKLLQMESEIVDLENDKLDEPALAGTAGQVLMVDNSLNPTWANQTAVALDATLTDPNKGAPADVVGDIVNSGKDIIWNQLASTFTRASGTLSGGISYTKSADGKKATFNGTSTTSIDYYLLINSGLGTSIPGHKYIVITPNIYYDEKFFFYLTSRDVRDRGNGAIWTASSAQTIQFGIQIYLGATFNNLTIDLPIIADLTEMFGAGNEPTVSQFKAMFPDDTYPYDSGTQRKLSRIELNASNIQKNSDSIKNITKNVKLKILSFNCGHYNYGSGTEGNWTGDTLTQKINEWKSMLAKYKPDIMLGQEMSNYFDQAQTVNAIDTIFKPLLPYYYFISWTRLLSKFNYVRTWQEAISVTIGGVTTSRDFGTAIININDVDILICSVHLPPGSTAGDTAIREAMRDKIIIAFSSYPYVILGGDFNESTDSFYTPFESAGYSLGNHGYFGTINTLPSESVDNIIVKGFAFYDALTNSADACTSDHYPFASEIHII